MVLKKQVEDLLSHMDEMGITRKELQRRLVCSSTLFSLHLSGSNNNPVGTTTYIFNKLADKDVLEQFMDWTDAKARFPSIQSIKEKYGARFIIDSLGVSEASVYTWLKNPVYERLWKNPIKPLVSLGAVRLLATILASDEKRFEVPEEKTDDVVVGGADAPKNPGNVPEEDVPQWEKNPGETLEALAALFKSGLPLSKNYMIDVWDCVEEIKGLVGKAVEVRRQQLERELELLKGI